MPDASRLAFQADFGDNVCHTEHWANDPHQQGGHKMLEFSLQGTATSSRQHCGSTLFNVTSTCLGEHEFGSLGFAPD
jgi:hypothetical protein